MDKFDTRERKGRRKKGDREWNMKSQVVATRDRVFGCQDT